MSHTRQQERNRHLRLVVGTGWDTGITRKYQPNEDSLFAIQGAQTYHTLIQPFGVFVVADGMGGYVNGQEAGHLAISAISNSVVPPLLGNAKLGDTVLSQLLADGVQRANHALYQRNQQVSARMGTTVTAVLVAGSTAYVTNVGDCRTYLYREPGELYQVTRDHSIATRLVEASITTPDDIDIHPERNQVYSTLGEEELVQVNILTVPLQAGDKLLLCSDGLWATVRDSNIQRMMRAPVADPSETVKALIEAALKHRGKDNVSVIVVFVSC